MIETAGWPAVVRCDRDGKEVSVVGDERAVFLERSENGLFLFGPGGRNDEAGFEAQPLAHRRHVRVG